MEGARRRHSDGQVTIEHMVSKPEMCRKILKIRFPDLEIDKNNNTQNSVEEIEMVGGQRTDDGPGVTHA